MKAWFAKSWKVLVSILGALLAIALTILTFGLWRTRGQRDAARDEATIAKATSDIRRLEALREEVGIRAGQESEAVAHLDVQIAEQKRRVVAAAGEGEGLSDEELEAALKRVLGG